MPVLRIPTAIAGDYKRAIKKLKQDGLSNTISQHMGEYDELCTELLALEMVCVGGFLKAKGKKKYLKVITGLLERFYQELSGTATSGTATSGTATSGTRMNCYPLQECGPRCCFGS
jgi:hypothetical protein